MNNFEKKLDSFFEIKKSGSTIKTEIIAGLTTFFAMCYIIVVNPGTMLGKEGDPSLWNAIFVGTILAAIVGTMLMALVAKMPFAQASGMGLNAFFFSTFMFLSGNQVESFGKGLAVIFLSGILFMILSITGARSFIAKALPTSIKKAIPAGIGLFIAFIGLQSAGIVVPNQFTAVSLGDFTTWSSAASMITAIVGLIIIGVLHSKKIKGDIIIGILISTGLFYVLSWSLPTFKIGNPFAPFEDFGKHALFNLNFTALFEGANFAGIINTILLVITFCLVDMFDTIGTLYGTARQANMFDKNGDPKNMDKCMLCDSIATVTGSLMGTSTVTTFVESSAGVAVGGRTGLTSVVVSALFLVSLFLSPIASIIPSAATAPALMFVGVLMISSIKEVNFSDMTDAIPAFLTMIMMVLTYSIANGIAFGLISFVLLKACSGKFKDINIVVVILAVLFILRFAFVK